MKEGKHLHDLWIVQIPPVHSPYDILPDILDQVKEEIVLMLEVSCLMPPRRKPSIISRISRRTSGVDAYEEREVDIDERTIKRMKTRRSQQVHTLTSDDDDVSLTEEEVQNYFDVSVLKKLWMDGEHKEVGRRELLLIEPRNKNDRIYINHRILALDGVPFSIK